MTLPPDSSSATRGYDVQNVRGGIVSRWMKTTTGVAVMLLVVQFLTGLLLAFYYVPSVDHAHSTVSFIEKVLTSGSWIRALHHYGSQWLSLFLFLHLIRLYAEEAYRRCKSQWLAGLMLLGLVFAGAATGYSLPWDARAFYSTRVAEGLVNGLPLIGSMATMWLLGGQEISTLTLSRFFALHVLVTPFLILAVFVWSYRTTRLSFNRERDAARIWPEKAALARQVIAAGLVFVALATWTIKYPAPLGPSAASVGAEYLPRPGAQFLWLFQMLKYVPGSIGSIVGIVVPGFVFLLLALLPWLRLDPLKRLSIAPQRLVGGLILSLCVLLVTTMTTVSYLSDRRDARTRQQLARQAIAEQAFRHEPFTPALLEPDDEAVSSASRAAGAVSQNAVPAVFLKFCANCHGQHGEGARQGRLKFPSLIGVSAKPRRSIDDIVALLNDPTAFGLEPPMKSFATKLTDQEKRDIAQWIVSLK